MRCDNYRGIALLCTGYKVLANIICDRLCPHLETITGKYQCGFMKAKSTTDQIFTIRQILEKTHEYNIPTFHLFIDFKAAYDSVRRHELYMAMTEFGIPEKLVRMTKMTMHGVRGVVRMEGDISREFDIRGGLKQGDGLSCILFNIALEKAIRTADVVNRGTILNRSIQTLGYADDLDIIGRSIPEVRGAFLKIEEAARRMGLVINEHKLMVASS